jgi:hypothetical protein
MSREFEQPSQGYPTPPEWFQQGRDSISSEPDVHPAHRQSIPQIRGPMAAQVQYSHISDTAALLPPTPRLGSHSYSVADSEIQPGSGAGTPPMDHRNSSWSTASLLHPTMNKSRWYSQVNVSEVSLGSYATLKDSRTSMITLNDPNRPGTIVRLHDRDDVEEWKGPFRALYFLAPFLILIDVGLYLSYLGFRLYCNIDVQRTTGISIGPAWVFFAVEFLITIPYLLNNGWAMFALKKRNRPRLRLSGNIDLPTVDVFVTCCKEENQVIMDTALAACDQDYPMDRFRVIILDDGKSAELEELADAARKNWPNLMYMSREKKPGVPHHFKAGNLNYGLEQVSLLPGGGGEFVAALDADMVRSTHCLKHNKLTSLDSRTTLASCSSPAFAQ